MGQLLWNQFNQITGKKCRRKALLVVEIRIAVFSLLLLPNYLSVRNLKTCSTEMAAVVNCKQLLGQDISGYCVILAHLREKEQNIPTLPLPVPLARGTLQLSDAGQ